VGEEADDFRDDDAMDQPARDNPVRHLHAAYYTAKAGMGSSKAVNAMHNWRWMVDVWRAASGLIGAVLFVIFNL
jgi:hypothetical protein